MAKSKFRSILTVLSTVLLISGLFTIDNLTQNHLVQNNESDHSISPFAAGDIAPIYIDGNTELSTFIANEGLSGQGTFASPYIIENYTIDASSGHGIQIRNTDDYLIIQNCTVSAGNVTFFGINLYNVTNVNVRNNSLQENYFGIYLSSSSNNTFSGNHANNNSYGIMFSYSNNNTLSWNNASYNNDHGIFVSSSNITTLSWNNASYNGRYGIGLSSSINTTVFKNNASYNSQYGISLASSSSNNTLSGNTACFNLELGIFLYQLGNNNTLSENNVNYNSGYGIWIYNLCNNNNVFRNNVSYNGAGIALTSVGNNTLSWNNITHNTGYGISLSSSSSNNTFFWNNVSHNTGTGISLASSSSSNTLSWNTVSNNHGYGIFLASSSKNTICVNIFLENIFGATNCYNTSDNSWDNGTLGNYWGDYQENYPAATNNLTTWNIPYQIDANNTDYFPLVTMDASEGENANTTISHPVDMNFIVGSAENILEWTLSDITIQDPFYTIYLDGTLFETDSWTPGVPILITLDTLDILLSGIYIFSIVAVDGLGGNISDNVKVTVWNGMGLVSYEPIFIDGDDEANDWNTFPEKTGSGTFGDPYIIENFEIDANASGSGIFIRDSDVYMEIINCTISNSGITYGDAGIRLENCENINIINCTLNNNGYFGIYLDASSNITISWNNASNNTQYGISLHDSSYNVIYFNIFLENIIGSALCLTSSDNSWDNGTHGNYWGDYEDVYPSASNDGTTWDTPYQIDVDNIDSYPLVNPPRQTDSPTDTDDDMSDDVPTDDDTDDNPSETGMKYEPFLWIVAGIIIIFTIYLFVNNNKKEKNRDIDTYEEFQEQQKNEKRKNIHDLPKPEP
ncbi:MAG: NosD domain-containing protein [Promethearchaeota archaeon]